MSKILKGVLVYSILILGALVVVGGATIGVMLLSSTGDKPLELFGYKAIFVSKVLRDDVGLSTEEFANNSVINININAGDYGVNVREFDTLTNQVAVRKRDTVIGLYEGEFQKEVYTNVTRHKETIEIMGQPVEVPLNEYTIDITVVQPSGFMLYGGSYITVSLPSYADFVYNLNIVTTSGSVDIDGSNDIIEGETDYNIIVGSLSVTTKTGDLSIFKINNAQSSQENEMVLNTLYLSTGSGTFDLSNIDTVRLGSPSEENPINIISKRGKFVFNKVYGAMNMVGQDQMSLEAKEIYTSGFGFNYDSDYGYFKIEKLNVGVYENSINTTNVNIDIKEIIGELRIVTRNGKINIDKAHNSINLKSTSGNIVVKEALGHITAETSKGDILVSKYNLSALFISQSGYVEANYNGDEANPTNLTTVQVDTSFVKLTNIYNAIDIKSTGSVNVKLYFQPLTQEEITHKVDIKAGKVELHFNTVPSLQPFVLIAQGSFTGVYGSEQVATLLSGSNGSPVEVLGPSDCTLNVKTGSGKATFYTHSA